MNKIVLNIIEILRLSGTLIVACLGATLFLATLATLLQIEWFATVLAVAYVGIFVVAICSGIWKHHLYPLLRRVNAWMSKP
jgi:hypothetical protein